MRTTFFSVYGCRASVPVLDPLDPLLFGPVRSGSGSVIIFTYLEPTLYYYGFRGAKKMLVYLKIFADVLTSCN
jgi:hypothetical protein